MTDKDALDFLKEHRRILAEEMKGGTLINYDIDAFDVAITALEEKIMTRHKMTDYECIKKIRDLIEYTAWDEDDDIKFRQEVVKIILEHDSGKTFTDPVLTAIRENSAIANQRPNIDFTGTKYDI